MESKNLEFVQMTKKYDVAYEEGKNISPFTMVVKGAIDAGMNNKLCVARPPANQFHSYRRRYWNVHDCVHEQRVP